MKEVWPLGNEWKLLWSGRSSLIANFKRNVAPTTVAAESAPCFKPILSLLKSTPAIVAAGSATRHMSVEVFTAFCAEERWKSAACERFITQEIEKMSKIRIILRMIFLFQFFEDSF